MKKAILIASASLMVGLLPTLSHANSFVDLVNQALAVKAGVCGDPSQQSASQFCQCFDAQMIEGCKKRLPPASCTVPRLKAQIQGIGVDLTCHKYPPAGVSFNECVTDINFFLSSC